MHIFRQTNFPLLLLIPSISTPVCTNSLNLSYNTAPTVSIPCHWTSQFIVPLTDSGRIAVLWESTGKCPFWKSKPQPGIAVVGLWYHHSSTPACHTFHKFPVCLPILDHWYTQRVIQSHSGDHRPIWVLRCHFLGYLAVCFLHILITPTPFDLIHLNGAAL